MQSSSRDVQIAEEWAKEYKHNKFPSNPTDEDGLVVNEIAAIHLYTMSLKKELHHHLKKAHPRETNKQHEKLLIQHLQLVHLLNKQWQQQQW